CRWDQIAPPDKQEEVVTLLVKAREGFTQSQVFSKVMRLIDEVYGTPTERQPISVTKLRLKTTYNRLRTEIRAKFGRSKSIKLLQTALTTFYGYVYFRTGKGKRYLENLV